MRVQDPARNLLGKPRGGVINNKHEIVGAAEA